MSENVIEYKSSWFNPIFYHINKYLGDGNIRRILLYGGSSAAKTHSTCQALCIDGYSKNYSSLVFRKEQASIKDTIKNEIIASIENSRMVNAYETFEFEFRGNKGNKIRLRGLDKQGKVKGLKGYKKLYFDELDHFTFDDWNEAGRRLRGEDNQQIIASWNPVSENHWIKTKYLDLIEWNELPNFIEGNPYSILDDNSSVKISKDGRTILIKTTYKDNKWIVGGNVNGKEFGRSDVQVIEEFEQMKLINPSDYNIYALGNWGIISVDDPFFYAYSETLFYRDIEPNIWKGEYLYLSLDFNKNPCTLNVGQKMSKTHQTQIIETLETDPNTIKGLTPVKALASIIKTKYIDSGLFTKNKIIVTGDETGTRGNAGMAEKYGFYTQFFEELGLKINTKNLLLPSKNPLHTLSSEICNNFLNTYRGGGFYIHDEDLNNEIKATYNPLKDAKDKLGLHKLDGFRYLVHLWCDFENHTEQLKKTAKKLSQNKTI